MKRAIGGFGAASAYCGEAASSAAQSEILTSRFCRNDIPVSITRQQIILATMAATIPNDLSLTAP
jgi:hypothetical protein